ncbi:MAG: class I SAM-dependent methyltransferase, partial [Silvanigrellaceae bacterium]|nr:class I SAM-dependent methyltransferase [Silvanigrellaceae bacterium]
MQQSEIQKFWNEVGSTKEFTDPFFADKFSALVKKDSFVVEYGCGYGRVFNHLAHLGFQNLKGFDFAPKMLERGRKTF